MADAVQVDRNLEAVRLWDAEAGRESFREALKTVWDPDASYFPARRFPEATPCHGVDAIAAWVESFTESWAWGGEVVELTPVGDDRVLAKCRLIATGRESGLELEGDLYQCVWLRHGRILRLEDHLTEAGARWAIGLED